MAYYCTLFIFPLFIITCIARFLTKQAVTGIPVML